MPKTIDKMRKPCYSIDVLFPPFHSIQERIMTLSIFKITLPLFVASAASLTIISCFQQVIAQLP